ncbi:hypothetical protein A3848_25465 [Paenibacillus sp. P32E]|nr:hypothetical protein A3848_25465 [Paenibacillus sp. P32E]
MIQYPSLIYFSNLILREAIFLATKLMAQRRFGIGLRPMKHPIPFRLKQILKTHERRLVSVQRTSLGGMLFQ